jgi:hypothetical protein
MVKKIEVVIDVYVKLYQVISRLLNQVGLKGS